MVSNKKYSIVFTENAAEELEEIFTYISEIFSAPETAIKQKNAILESIDRLENFPNSYELLNHIELKEKAYRKLIVNNYLVFYLVDENEKRVMVMRILYNKRNYQDILK